MIEIGRFNTLTIARLVDPGAILTDETAKRSVAPQ